MDVCLGNPVSNHPLNRGLIYWCLGVPPYMGGGRLYDLTRKYEGVLTNGPTWASSSGHPGGQETCRLYSLKFDGNNDYVGLGSSSVFAPAGGLSVMVWFRLTTLSVSQILFCKGNNTSWFVRFQQPSSIRFSVSTGGGTTNLTTSSGVISAANTWYCVCATYDGANMNVYSNGVLVGGPTAKTGTISGGTDELRIATLTDGALPLSGQVAEGKIWGRGLSAAEVRAVYLESLLGHPVTLRRYIHSIAADTAAPLFQSFLPAFSDWV